MLVLSMTNDCPPLGTRHQQFFPPARAQHIQINAHMTIEKPLAEKTAFAGSLNSDKNYCFHNIVAIVGTLGPRNLLSGYVYLILDNLGGLGPCRIAEHTGS